MVLYSVATGPWSDQSLAGWSSSMITLEVTTGGYLISALATFITIIGGRFWVIVAFAIHQYQSTEDQKDVLFHQHQLVYRNSDSQLSAAWYVVRMAWAWRKRARRVLLRSLLYLLPPIFCFAGFTVASVNSNRVTTPSYTANRVRVVSRNCGYLNWNAPENYDGSGNLTSKGAQVYAKWYATRMAAGRNYARTCYGKDASDSITCNELPVQQLPYATDDAADCPFKEGRCLLGPKKAFRVTTPWLSSHEHFGINAPPNDRVGLRRSAVCSVLDIKDLTAVKEGSQSSFYAYYLGPYGTSNGPGSPTYLISDTVQNDNIPYRVLSYAAIAYDPFYQTGWQPIADFNRTDADVVAFFLNQNSMRYPGPIDDPFFAAHRKGPLLSFGSPVYTADALTTVIGCTEQFQLRNEQNNITTAMSSIFAVEAQSRNLGLNEFQQETAYRLMVPAGIAIMGRSITVLPGDALRASNSAFYTLSLEVQGWFEEALAIHQLEVMSFVSKEVDDLLPYAQVVHPNATSSSATMCDTQIMRNTGAYQTFSVLGISLIASIGVLIYAVSVFLESVMAAIRKRRRRKEYKSAAWRADALLFQHHLALSTAQQDLIWENLDDAVPVTTRDETRRRALPAEA
ncbi:hypothetical protein GQ53DRAFT_833016 [Thozetella sp. PMI_491]|nr:hypothetical protein GQ53DRAFT_834855 [Thozetella sp. PMI_491]KAH8880842.1 hypothetical protein GQ53DRAFT_833016 [Thozetella sp. PMI_491]